MSNRRLRKWSANPGCPKNSIENRSKHYSKKSDNHSMKLSVVFPIVGDVLKSPVVIGTAIVVILYLNFVFFVARYKKKPSKPKKRRVVAAPAPAPKPAEENEDEAESEAS